MNILELAELELRRENKKPCINLILDRAKTIRKYLDIQARNKKVAENRYSNKKFALV